MPCNSDHMEPTVQERQRSQAAQFLVFVNNRLGIPVSKKLKAAAEDVYGGPDGEKYMIDLCDTIRSMTEGQQDAIVYNGRDPMSRRLADWWDEHKAEDAKRKERERDMLRTAAGAKKFFDQNKLRAFEAVVREYAQNAEYWIDIEDSVHWFDLTDGVLIASSSNGVEVWVGKKL